MLVNTKCGIQSHLICACEVFTFFFFFFFIFPLYHCLSFCWTHILSSVVSRMQGSLSEDKKRTWTKIIQTYKKYSSYIPYNNSPLEKNLTAEARIESEHLVQLAEMWRQAAGTLIIYTEFHFNFFFLRGEGISRTTKSFALYIYNVC